MCHWRGYLILRQLLVSQLLSQCCVKEVSGAAVFIQFSDALSVTVLLPLSSYSSLMLCLSLCCSTISASVSVTVAVSVTACACVCACVCATATAAAAATAAATVTVTVTVTLLVPPLRRAVSLTARCSQSHCLVQPLSLTAWCSQSHCLVQALSLTAWCRRGSHWINQRYARSSRIRENLTTRQTATLLQPRVAVACMGHGPFIRCIQRSLHDADPLRSRPCGHEESLGGAAGATCGDESACNSLYQPHANINKPVAAHC